MKNQANVVDEGETNGLGVKLEDDSRDARMGFKLPFVVTSYRFVRRCSVRGATKFVGTTRW